MLRLAVVEKMKSTRNYSLPTFFVKTFSLLIVSLVLLILPGIVKASDTITSMDDLPKLSETISAKSITPNVSRDIVILYKEDSSNNIGKLSLKRDDFQAGESLNGQVDVLRTSGETDAEILLEEISSNSAVDAASYDKELYATALPNDTYINEEYAYTNTGMSSVWNRGSSTLVKVAVLDSGVSSTHEDLKNRVERSGVDYSNAGAEYTGVEDFTGHGTKVAGVLAAQANNGVGIAGFAGSANVKIVPYRVTRSNGSAPLSNFISAIVDICNRDDIRVINISYGSDSPSAVEERAFEVAASSNKIVVAAAGNENSSSVCYPAAYSTVIGVGGTNENNIRCTTADWGTGHGSNYGPGLDLVAPANKLVTTSYKTSANNSYVKDSGTSFATPMVAGVASLILSLDSSLSADRVKNILYTSAQDLGASGYDVEYGYGLLRADKAVQAVTGSTTKTETVTVSPTSVTLKVGESKQLTASSSNAKPITFKSSNTGVATVTGTGKITAVKAGTATITASLTSDSSVKATCKVTVTTSSSGTDTTVQTGNILTVTPHVENYGWMQPVGNGGIAGTFGQALRVEAFMINPLVSGLTIEYQAHVENIGWQNWVSNGQIAGTTGRALQIEAINMRLSGTQASNYDLYYRTHVENYGWTNWASAGQQCGTANGHLRLEALQVCLVPKGSNPPNVNSNVSWAFTDRP